MTGKNPRQVVVLARRDPIEAMRVSSGLTIFGHKVSLVFAHGVLEITPEAEEQAEMLELAEVEPHSLFDDPEVPKIGRLKFLEMVQSAEAVINV